MKAKKILSRLSVLAVILLTSLFAHAEEEEKPEEGPIPTVEDLIDLITKDIPWWSKGAVKSAIETILEAIPEDSHSLLVDLPQDFNHLFLDTSWYQWVLGRTFFSWVVVIWTPFIVFLLSRLLLRKLGWWRWAWVFVILPMAAIYMVCRFHTFTLEFSDFTGDRYLHLYTPWLYEHGGVMTAAYFLPFAALLIEWRWLKDMGEAHLRRGLLNHLFGDGELLPEKEGGETEEEEGPAQADTPNRAEPSAPSPAASPAVTPQAQPEPQQSTAAPLPQGGRRRSRRTFSY